MISTLEAYFQGKRELFKGLDIEKLEKEWTVRPVLHLDLNSRNYNGIESLKAILNQHLENGKRCMDVRNKTEHLKSVLHI